MVVQLHGFVMAGTNDTSAGWLWVQVADEQQGLFFKYPVVPGKGGAQIVIRIFEQKIPPCIQEAAVSFPFPALFLKWEVRKYTVELPLRNLTQMTDR